jgi:hypothetical protein
VDHIEAGVGLPSGARSRHELVVDKQYIRFDELEPGDQFENDELFL